MGKPHYQNRKQDSKMSLRNKLLKEFPLDAAPKDHLPLANFFPLKLRDHPLGKLTQKHWRKLVVLQKRQFVLYNSHTNELFKSTSILKLEDMYSVQQIKYTARMINKQLP